MITQIYIILHIFLILASAFAILILPPKYFTKWYNRKRFWNKSFNKHYIYAIWWIFLLVVDVIISLNYRLW